MTRSVALLVLTINSALLLYPAFSNLTGRVSAKSQPLKIISLNVWYRNQSINRIVDFLKKEQADIVLLQEVSGQHLRAIRQSLSRLYPFVHTCDCRNLVLLSRFSWQIAGGQRLTKDKPAAIWARFAKPGRGSYRVVGVHTLTPFYLTQHTRQMRWLTEKLPSGERLIVGGDFNATPWSTRLMRMSKNYGLRRAATFANSWPSHVFYPLFLIDNVFVSNLFQIRSTTIGPDVGSDHRPVIVQIAIPS